jgi:hypothetical protein
MAGGGKAFAGDVDLMAILKKIIIDEISAVRKPAQKHARALIMKSETYGAETAEDDFETVRKMAADGHLDDFKKHQFMELIHLRADDIRRDGETVEKAFTRCIESDPCGRELSSLMKRARGSEVVERDAKEDDTPHYDGPADAELNRLARERQKVSGRSFAQSFSDVLDMPGNRKLTIAAAAERDLKMVRSLTPQQARDLEPGVKPFPAYGSPGDRYHMPTTGRTTGSVASGQRTQGR